MPKMFRLTVATLALLALPMSANAVYVGAAGAVESVEDFDDSDGTASILQVGMPLMPFLGAEFEYSSTMTEPENKGGAKIDTTMYRAFAVAGVPAGPVSLRLRVGYQYHDYEVGNNSETGTAPVYGVGLSYGLVPMVALVADYTTTELDAISGDDPNFDHYSLGVQVGF